MPCRASMGGATEQPCRANDCPRPERATNRARIHSQKGLHFACGGARAQFCRATRNGATSTEFDHLTTMVLCLAAPSRCCLLLLLLAAACFSCCYMLAFAACFCCCSMLFLLHGIHYERVGGAPLQATVYHYKHLVHHNLKWSMTNTKSS